MRRQLIALLHLAAGAMIALSQAPAANAADLTVSRVRHAHFHHGRIVRDYDGTPVVLGRCHPTHPVWLGDYPGLVPIGDHFVRTYPVQQQPLPYIRRHAYYLGWRAPYVATAGWTWQPNLAWWY